MRRLSTVRVLAGLALASVSLGCLHQVVDPSAPAPENAGGAVLAPGGMPAADAGAADPGESPRNPLESDAGDAAAGAREDAGPESAAGDADGGVGVSPDAGSATDGPGGGTCSVWSDCGPFFGDPGSGYACEQAQCVCDPGGHARQNCATARGVFLEAHCYCQSGGGADDEAGAGCADPAQCEGGSGGDEPDPPPPPDDPGDDCIWIWVEPLCEPDRWVDTSHYEQRCGYDARDEYVCESVWVESGYWERGHCPAGYWDQRC